MLGRLHDSLSGSLEHTSRDLYVVIYGRALSDIRSAFFTIYNISRQGCVVHPSMLLYHRTLFTPNYCNLMPGKNRSGNIVQIQENMNK